VSKGSKQGKKEYISEVRIISRLRHRNLVQLIGWCHAGGELLLVYELMPNGSLDTHLYDQENILPWTVRYINRPQCTPNKHFMVARINVVLTILSQVVTTNFVTLLLHADTRLCSD
jgi:serine/threonine protein kinase